MTLQEFINEIRFKLSGGILHLEIRDEELELVIKSALRELQRYFTTPEIVTIPFKRCINLENPDDTNGVQLRVNTVVNVYRTTDLSNGDSETGYQSDKDPMQVAQWQLLSGMGNLTYFQDAVYNYGAWTTLQQIRNTTSTDLYFRYDENKKLLYINVSSGTPSQITIEYIPVIQSVEDIQSLYWIDILMRLSLAYAKITLGRIRTRYTQSNSLWNQDGDTMLNEGTSELKELQEMLLQNSELMYPID